MKKLLKKPIFDNAANHAKAIQKYDSVGSHYLLGLIYLDAKQHPQAKQELTQASKQDSIYKKDIVSLLSQLEGVAK